MKNVAIWVFKIFKLSYSPHIGNEFTSISIIIIISKGFTIAIKTKSLLKDITIVGIALSVAMTGALAQQHELTKLTATQEKSLKEWTKGLAVQAANYAAPLVTMYSLRYNDALAPGAKRLSQMKL